MKKILLVLVIASMTTLFLNAQEPTKQHETGISFNNLDEFGISYKTGTNTSLWRFRTLVLSGASHPQKRDSSETSNKDISIGFNVGKEYRKNINNDLAIIYGAELSFAYSRSKLKFDDISASDNDYSAGSKSYRPGINFVIGLNYRINDKISISTELLPGFVYSYNSSTTEYINNPANNRDDKRAGFTWGLSKNSALITMAYRF